MLASAATTRLTVPPVRFLLWEACSFLRQPLCPAAVTKNVPQREADCNDCIPYTSYHVDALPLSPVQCPYAFAAQPASLVASSVCEHEHLLQQWNTAGLLCTTVLNDANFMHDATMPKIAAAQPHQACTK